MDEGWVIGARNLTDDQVPDSSGFFHFPILEEAKPMKPWNAWVASLGCAGLCLALVGCGGSKDSESDLGAMAAEGGVATPPPASAPPAAVEPEAPAPLAEAPAPEPATPAPSETAAAPKPEAAPAPAESAAMTKPAGEASPAMPGGTAPSNPAGTDAVPGNPAMAANNPAAGAPGATTAAN